MSFRLYTNEEVEALLAKQKKELLSEANYNIVEASNKFDGALSEGALKGLRNAIREADEDYRVNWALNRAYKIGAIDAINNLMI